MSDAQVLIQRRLDALRRREAAAEQLLVGKGRVHRKNPEKAAKLPETECIQLKAVAKWEHFYSVDPSEYNRTKLERARDRLANTQKQLAKVAAQPFAMELAELHKEIAELEHVLAVIERITAESKRDLWEVLTERYVIDTITGDITLRSTGGKVLSETTMVNGVRYMVSEIRKILLTGGLV